MQKIQSIVMAPVEFSVDNTEWKTSPETNFPVV